MGAESSAVSAGDRLGVTLLVYQIGRLFVG